jgi:hypothetical protein
MSGHLLLVVIVGCVDQVVTDGQYGVLVAVPGLAAAD